MKAHSLVKMALLGLITVSWSGQTMAQEAADPRDKRIDELERRLAALAAEVRQLKAERVAEKETAAQETKVVARLSEQVEDLRSSKLLDTESWVNRFTLGGYGEMHANFGESDEPDKFDIHRLVLYLGYDFSDWIKFHSETEIEHAFVSDGDGEISIEQAYVDLLLSDSFNVRFGRILTPLGIINKTHEPPTFNGVERPSFAKYVIPTTWASDGLGIFGSVSPSLRYEAYVVGGLDGSKFTAKDGIRGGRIKERPSLNDVAFTGRLDYYPMVAEDQRLRLGLSGYAGGIDNGNKSDDPDVDGRIEIYSADFEYSISKLDLRGAIAHERIHDARDLGVDVGEGLASEIFGWYAEAGYHFWPESWRTGKLEESDAVVFVRYDLYDTQYKMPSGVDKNDSADREDWTFGLNFYLTPNLVVKADYQIRDAAAGHKDDLINVGLGFQF